MTARPVTRSPSITAALGASRKARASYSSSRRCSIAADAIAGVCTQGAGQAPGLRKVTETLAALAGLLPGAGVNVIVPVPPQGTTMPVVTGSVS